jgi:hypothetical protein
MIQAKKAAMAKSKTDDKSRQVAELQAKVLRRSQELAKSLRQLVAQTEPGRSPAQKLLTALESALPHLQQPAEASRSAGSKVNLQRVKKVKDADAPQPVRTRPVAKKRAGQTEASAAETATA